MNAKQANPFAAIPGVFEALGRDLLAWRGDETARHLYSKKDFKTEADRRADVFLKERMSEIFPGIPVWSEEDATRADRRPARYWLIDPIDGTASWYDGFAGFVTQGAFFEKGRPVYGVIHAPAFGMTWTGETGKGAWRNGFALERLHPSERRVLTDNTPEPHGFAALLMEPLRITAYRESGSLGLKSVLVADGTADLFVKNVAIRDWDVAPAAVILAEVGGRLTGLSGEEWDYAGGLEKTGGLIVARDDALLAEAVAAVRGLTV